MIHPTDIKQFSTGQISFDNLEDQEQKVECRICLGVQSTEQNYMLSPCNCKGSVKYVHFQCMANWIKKSNKLSQNKFGSISCEICKTQINYQTQYLKRCVNRQEFNQNISYSAKIFICCVITLVFLFAGLLASTISIVKLFIGELKEEDTFKGIVISVAIFFLTIFMVILLWFFYNTYLRIKMITIVKIGRLERKRLVQSATFNSLGDITLSQI